jgi:preprotein translocase subunit SecG
MHTLILLVLILIATFLILLVLVQRGRGGGLAGALGGMGGQSAFGAKAGDTFTKVTMWTAFIWIVFCIVSVRLLSKNKNPVDIPPGFSSSGESATEEGGPAGDTAPSSPDDTLPSSPDDTFGGDGKTP